MFFFLDFKGKVYIYGRKQKKCEICIWYIFIMTQSQNSHLENLIHAFLLPRISFPLLLIKHWQSTIYQATDYKHTNMKVKRGKTQLGAFLKDRI